MSSKKFPSLFNIVKKDDVDTLISYLYENPDYDLTSDTIFGSSMYYYSIDLSSIKIFMYITNRLDLDHLSLYSNQIVNKYKYNPKYFDYYYVVVKKLSKEENNNRVINKIVLSILNFHNKLYKDLFDRVTSEYDFLGQFENDLFRKSVENRIVENKSLWLIFFEKYYRENNISRNHLFVKCLIFSKFDNSKYIKLFKGMNYSDKVKIEACYDYSSNSSRHEYSLEFIMCVTCDINDYSKMKIMKDGRFEEELFNLFSEAVNEEGENFNRLSVLKDGENIIFYPLMKKINEKVWYYEYIIPEKFYEKIVKIVPYVSERFIEYMKKNLGYEGFDIDEYLRTHASYSVGPYYIKNSRILLKRIMDEYERVHQ